VECTGGNPLYVGEVVRQALIGDATRAGGLALVLAHRVAEVSMSSRRVVGAAALLGAGATVAETAQVLDCPPARVLAVLCDEALGTRVAGNEIHFSHELLRAAYAAALPAPERQQLHVAALGAIRGPDAGHVMRRAHHAVEAAALSSEHIVLAVRLCIQAARLLQGALAFEQAADWAGRAAALASSGADPAIEATALLTHADAVLACGRLADAHELFGQAVRPAEAAADHCLLARAALGFGGVWLEEQRDELARRRLLRLCRDALAALPPEEAVLAARLEVRLAAESTYDGTGAVEDVAVTVDRVRQLGDAVATAEALSLYHHTAPRRRDGPPAGGRRATQRRDRGRRNHLLAVRPLLADGRSLPPRRQRSGARLRQSPGTGDRIGEPVCRLHRRGPRRHAHLPARGSGAGRGFGGRGVDLGLAAGDADALAYYGGHLLAIRPRVAWTRWSR
jgi:hypothetical protein